MTTADSTTTALQKMRDDILRRARGFAAHEGIFNGQLVAEELSFWVKRIDALIISAQENNDA